MRSETEVVVTTRRGLAFQRHAGVIAFLFLAGCQSVGCGVSSAVLFVGTDRDVCIMVWWVGGTVVAGSTAYLGEATNVAHWSDIRKTGDFTYSFTCDLGGPSKSLPFEWLLEIGKMSSRTVYCRMLLTCEDRVAFDGWLVRGLADK